MNRFRFHFGLFVLLGIAVPVGCRESTPSTEVTSLSGMTMGTSYSIKLHGLPVGSSTEQLHQEIRQRLQQINKQMSTYDPDSELSRFNQHADESWFPVSEDTVRVVATALEISRKTDGAFDVTVGPLVNLWNFGPDPKLASLPTDAEIEAARSRVDYKAVRAQLSPPALRKLQPNVYLDLSSIAKGFAVDAIADLVAERGSVGFMVEIGGEVRTRGTKPDGSPWRIGIEKPVSLGRSVHQVVNLTDCSLATSGDYRNFFERDGRRYSHEIDPRTGYPVEHALASVSVITTDCMLADAWATALIVAGPNEARRLAKMNELNIMLIERADDGFRDEVSPGFAEYLQPLEPTP